MTGTAETVRNTQALEQALGNRRGSWVGGTWPEQTDTFAVYDPSTGALLAHVGDASAHDAENAVMAADRALGDWATMPGWERYEVLRRAADLLRSGVEDLASVICAETGKPIAEARGEAGNTVRFFEWFSHETLRLSGDAWPDVAGGRDAAVLHEPVGVVAAITPWNFPAFMVACKVGAALAAGCTVVLKPAPQTPLTALVIARAFERAGLPPGVLNVVTSSDPQRVSDVLLGAPKVACVSLTGSRRVGEIVMARAARSIKRVLLELGGNAPAIVLPDADLAKTAQELVRARFLNAGQACMAANRVYVVEPDGDALIAELTARVGQLVVGDPRDERTTTGPLIDCAAVERLESQVSRAVEEGCEITVGGRRRDENHASAYFEPTLVVVPRGAQPTVLDEELFGPVLSVVRCGDVDQALQLANATEYGLAGYVFSADQSRAIGVARRLTVGSVGVNCALVSEPSLPFGGMKASGLGRERGRAGIEEYLETKTLQFPSVSGT